MGPGRLGSSLYRQISAFTVSVEDVLYVLSCLALYVALCLVVVREGAEYLFMMFLYVVVGCGIVRGIEWREVRDVLLVSVTGMSAHSRESRFGYFKFVRGGEFPFYFHSRGIECHSCHCGSAISRSMFGSLVAGSHEFSRVEEPIMLRE